MLLAHATLQEAFSALLARTRLRDSKALHDLHVSVSYAAAAALWLARQLASRRTGAVLAISSLGLAGLCAAWTHRARLDFEQSPVCQDCDPEGRPSSLALPPDGYPVDDAAAVAHVEAAGDGVPAECHGPATPPQYEPFQPPTEVKISSVGRNSPDSPMAMLPDGATRALNSSFGGASASSGSVPTSRGSQLAQQWMGVPRSPESDYVPFGGGAPQPSTSGGVSHDDLCAALVAAVTAVREEADAETRAALAVVRAQAARELREAVDASEVEAEASTAAAVAAARLGFEEEMRAAVDVATAEAEARMESAMVRVHLLMLGSVIAGATVAGIIELVGIATKGAGSKSAGASVSAVRSVLGRTAAARR